MRDTPVVRPSSAFLASYYNPAPANKTYTIPRPDPANPPPADSGDMGAQPNVYMLLTIGSAQVHVDVLRGNEVLGALAGSPLMYLPKGESRLYFSGLMADGKVLQEGVYRLRMRALRIFGDETKEEDWDVVDTVEFGFTYEG